MAERKEPSFFVSLLSGGIAGTTVDVALYPLDTIKTRLQSPQGFLKAGGFSGVYKGLSAAAVGSAPGAALFFSTYEMSKQILHDRNSSSSGKQLPQPVIHMIAASIGETIACMVRVPTEVVKQRMQTGMYSSFGTAISQTFAKEGMIGFYSGFAITIMREIPFSLVQFPLYEYMKTVIPVFQDGAPPGATQSAVCGSLSGAVAAAFTTPLDVIKTRLMLGADSNGVPYKSAMDTARRVFEEGKLKNIASLLPNAEGANVPKSFEMLFRGSLGPYGIFFSGVGPRVTWISIGGFVFFGAYEKAKQTLIYAM